MGINKRLRVAQEAQAASTRRTFLLLSGTSVGLAAGGYTALKAYETFHPSFSTAFNDPEKRNQWLATIEAPPYVSLSLLTPELLRSFQRQGYTPPETAFAATIPVDERITKGAHSKVILYDEAFNPLYAPVRKGLGIIIENVLKRHEFLHAQHFNSGIPEVPSTQFMNPDGTWNKELFKATSEVLAYRNEFNGLLDEKDPFVVGYASKLSALARMDLRTAAESTTDNRFLEQLLEWTNY
jgi:hypothetical protein